MQRSWLQRAALCACFSLFAQIAHAQVYIPRAPQSAASESAQSATKTPITDAVRKAAATQTQDPHGFLSMMEDWMNGWTLMGLLLAGIGSTIYYTAEEGGIEDYENKTAEVGAYMVLGGAGLILVGTFVDKGHVWVKPVKGGAAAGVTWKFGGR